MIQQSQIDLLVVLRDDWVSQRFRSQSNYMRNLKIHALCNTREDVACYWQCWARVLKASDSRTGYVEPVAITCSC